MSDCINLRANLKKSYRIIDDPIQARLVRRVNRFACCVQLNGKPIKVYLPNSGRLEELLLPGSTVLLEKRRASGKTKHDLLLVRSRRYPDRVPIWVGVDSRLPQHLLRWVIENRLSDKFGQPYEIRNEPRFESGRFDLSFSPFAERDPAFAQILQQAMDEEVNILAMKFDAGTEMKYMGELELLLPPVPFSGFWPDRP